MYNRCIFLIFNFNEIQLDKVINYELIMKNMKYVI